MSSGNCHFDGSPYLLSAKIMMLSSMSTSLSLPLWCYEYTYYKYCAAYTLFLLVYLPPFCFFLSREEWSTGTLAICFAIAVILFVFSWKLENKANGYEPNMNTTREQDTVQKLFKNAQNEIIFKSICYECCTAEMMLTLSLLGMNWKCLYFWWCWFYILYLQSHWFDWHTSSAKYHDQTDQLHGQCQWNLFFYEFFTRILKN